MDGRGPDNLIDRPFRHGRRLCEAWLRHDAAMTVWGRRCASVDDPMPAARKKKAPFPGPKEWKVY
jgi:hypothetical protein